MTPLCIAVRYPVVAIFLLSMLAGCAATPLGPTVQVLPGPGIAFETFKSDNTSCKAFASEQIKAQADASNQRAMGAALLTTAIGATTGAVAGAAIGASNSSNDHLSIQQQYDIAFSQCMYAKGEATPGYASKVASVPAAPVEPALSTALPSTESEETIEQFFPWPPPQPFLYEMRRRQAFPDSVRTLDDIRELLESKLAHSGYSDFRFFLIRRDGFALVTRMERIDAQQRSIAGSGRWEDSGGLALDAGSFSIPAYLRALFTRRTGNFRVFVMIVTPEDVVPDPDKQLQPEMVQDWQRRGALSLPDFLGQLPFSDRHKVYVLVYEFRKEEGQEPKPVRAGTVPEHLNAAGIHLWNPS